MLSAFLQEGGENTAILFLFITLAGALVMTVGGDFELAVPGVVLLAVGMGFTKAAVFLVLLSLVMVWILKYAPPADAAPADAAGASPRAAGSGP